MNNDHEDAEDIAKAKEILSRKNRTWTQDEIERELGFDFSKED